MLQIYDSVKQLKSFDENTIYGRVVHGNDASVRVFKKSDYLFINEEFGAKDDPYGSGMLVFRKAAD
jgi:ribosomal-protein-alanine N-acetyltransferase